MMPGIDGFEVTRRIRQNIHLPFIPILLITGHNQLEEAKAFKMGASGLLYKPIDPDRLLEQIRDILGERLSHLKNG
jgi:CheY-like chemotaxis protein